MLERIDSSLRLLASAEAALCSSSRVSFSGSVFNFVFLKDKKKAKA